MGNSQPTPLKREALIPLPASRRLTLALSVGVLMISFAAFMDAMLWTVLNQPVRARRDAVARHELRELRVQVAVLAAEAREERQRAETLSAALTTCTAEVDADPSPPQFATPCSSGEIKVTVEPDGPTLCLTQLTTTELAADGVSADLATTRLGGSF